MAEWRFDWAKAKKLAEACIEVLPALEPVAATKALDAYHQHMQQLVLDYREVIRSAEIIERSTK